MTVRLKPPPRVPRRVSPQTGDRSSAGVSSSRRQGGSPQDQALYSCGCGYVFEAAVCTSVGCPHCGQTQAW